MEPLEAIINYKRKGFPNGAPGEWESSLLWALSEAISIRGQTVGDLWLQDHHPPPEGMFDICSSSFMAAARRPARI